MKNLCPVILVTIDIWELSSMTNEFVQITEHWKQILPKLKEEHYAMILKIIQCSQKLFGNFEKNVKNWNEHKLLRNSFKHLSEMWYSRVYFGTKQQQSTIQDILGIIFHTNIEVCDFRSAKNYFDTWQYGTIWCVILSDFHIRMQILS